MIKSRVNIESIHFTLVMDEITKNIQGDISWCMFFIDDVVLIDENRIGVQELELWRQILELKDFRLSRAKTEYMMCQFSVDNSNDGNISLDGQIVPMNDTF
jgi:hypothetical protein